ncbi:MAG: hypothetical protein KDA53_17520 [Hyphomonas sp.]|nr:hypothetical protein [Hyphomonas sp.]
MVQAFNRLVGRGLALAAAPFLLAGCQCLWPFAPAAIEEDVNGEAEIASVPACPEVTSAESWVNRMPSVGANPVKLIVSLRIASEDAWMLSPADDQAGGALALDLVPGGNSVPGTVGYNQSQPSPLPDDILILCGGKEAARIGEVMIVQ